MITNENLTILERYERQLTRLREQEERLSQQNTANSEAQLALTRQRLELLRRGAQIERERVIDTRTLNKEQIAFAKSFAKLNRDVRNILTDQTTRQSAYKSLGNDIAKSKAIQVNLTGEELDREIEKEQLMTQMNQSLLQQAQTLAKTEAESKGISEFDERRLQLKENQLNLTQEEIDKLTNIINLEESIYKKNERIKAIQESQKDLYEAMPESLKGAVDFAKKLGTGLKTAGAGAVAFMLLATVVTATIKSFTALDESAKEFRETTGLTNSQMVGIKSDANEIVGQFGNLGIEAKNVFDTVAALKSEFSDIADFSQETTAALTVLGANFGVSAQNAAKVQGVLEQVGGLSSETAASVQLQVANMSKLAGVAPAKVFEDIAESAEISSTLFKGDTIALAKNAIEARRLGTNLKSVAATAEKLLDFEGGIEEELVAATFVGGQFNLSRARALAFEGKIVESQKEILAQVQRTGDFRQKDYFTQQQLAKAAGMSVEEINKQLNAQEKLSKLSTEERAKAEKAIEQGLDITNINAEQLAQETEKFSTQQEQQATLEQLQNSFMGIASTVGSVLVPLFETLAPIAAAIATPFQWMADGLAVINENLASMVVFYGAIAGYGAFILANKIREKVLDMASLALGKEKAAISFKEAVTSIFSSLAKIPFGVGLLLAAGAVAGMVGYFSKAGDVMSPADGKTRISTKEGGLFELSPNDDLIAAPGAAAALSGVATGVGGSGNTLNVDLSTLSAPLNMMINEIKGLRTDMNSGKIGVYMDTEKVTSKISRQVDSSTRNNFNLGQA